VIISNNHRDYNPNADNTLGNFFRDTGDYLGLLGIIWDNYSIIIPNSHQLTGLLNSETSRNLRQLCFFFPATNPQKSPWIRKVAGHQVIPIFGDTLW
jgi:hypothetical protein